MGAASNNDAFLFDSFCKEGNIADQSQNVEREDFELGLIIQQTQREAYERNEGRTFSMSSIDSNQENKDYPQMERTHHFRKPFAEIEEGPDCQPVNLEQLIDGMDEESNPEMVRHSGYRESEDSLFRSEKKFRSAEQEESTPYFSELKYNSRASGHHR